MEINTGIMGNSLAAHGNLLSVLTIILTIIISIGGIVGFLEIKKWRNLRKRMEHTIREMDKTKQNFDSYLAIAEKQVNQLGKQLQSVQLIDDIPAPIKAKFEEYDRALDAAQVFGRKLGRTEYLVRGNIAFSKDDLDTAIKAYDKALEINPNDTRVLHNKGVALEKLRKHEDALTVIDKAIAIKPNYAEAWFNKGVVLGNLGKHEDALAAFDKALSIKPELTGALSNKGMALWNLGRKDDALAAFDKAIFIDPEHAGAWTNKGKVLGHLKLHDKALEAFDKALSINPDFAEAWSNKGTALLELGRHDDALVALNKAISIKPSNASAHYNRACYYALKHDKKEVLLNLRHAIELDQKYKTKAKEDKDFEALWKDPDFIDLIN